MKFGQEYISASVFCLKFGQEYISEDTNRDIEPYSLQGIRFGQLEPRSILFDHPETQVHRRKARHQDILSEWICSSMDL